MPAQEDQITNVTGEHEVTPRYANQRTLQYKTFLKRAIAESLQNAFNKHPDSSLAKSKIGIEYATDRADFPAIVVKFYERSIKNAGVGHQEWGPSPDVPGRWIKYFHRIYHGDIEFEILALSSLDRDKMVDALIEVLMGEVSPEGETFLTRLYSDIGKTPYSQWHFLTLNTDEITGQGEREENAPWLVEDVLMYTVAYRMPMLGQFYSMTPREAGGTGLVSEIDLYPWDEVDPLDTPPEDFPEGKIPEEDYIKITGRSKFEIIGDTTEGQTLVANISSTEDLEVGMITLGETIPGGTKISQIVGPTSIELTQKALGTVAKVHITAIEDREKV